MKTLLQNLITLQHAPAFNLKALLSKVLLAIMLLVISISGRAQQITVSGSNGANGNYSSLTGTSGAFNAINGTGQSGKNILILINATEANETGSRSLSAGSWTSLTIRPATGAAKTISGSVSQDAMIEFNGTDNVVIDGLNILTISNTSTGGVGIIGFFSGATTTIKFTNDATGNTITNTTISGSSRAINTGTITFGQKNSIGNDNNTISNCDIGPAGANTPFNAIYSQGSTGATSGYNSGNTISNNKIHDFFIASNSTTGILLNAGNTGWTISGNRFYQSSTRTFTATAARYAAVKIDNTGDNYTLSNNIIGFANSSGTGTTTITGTLSGSPSGSTNGLNTEFRGIDIVSVGTGVATSIQGNTISGINQTTSRNSTTSTNAAFIGIMLASSGNGKFNVGNVAGNTIGSLDGSSTIIINESSTTNNSADIAAIYDFSYSGNTISNNNIGAITIQGTGTVVGFTGISTYNQTGVSETIANNTIGGPTAAGAIKNNQVGGYFMYGILSGLANATITGNTIRNISGNSNISGGYVVLSAITNSGSTGVNTISQNTIYSLTNNSGSSDASIYTLDLDFNSSNNNSSIVERNLIHSISNTGSSDPQIVGIYARAGVATYKNNVIRMGIDAAGNSLTLGNFIVGIWHASTKANNNFYHNSVYIGGTGVAPTSYSICLNSDVENVTRSYINNILYNARDNATPAYTNMAIWPAGSTLNPAGLTCNYNDLYAPSASGFLGIFNGQGYGTLEGWNAASGLDVNSVSDNPLFVNPSGTAATLNLEIQPGSICNNEAMYLPTVTIDFDAAPRNNPLADIGAYELLRGTVPGSWIGVTSTDWNTESNWDNLTIPAISTDVYIAGGHPHFPVIPTGVSALTKNLTLHRTNSTVSIIGEGVMKVNGGIANNGSFNVSDGTIEMNGSSAQNIPAGVFVNNSLKNLIISNSNGFTGVTLAGPLDITRSVTFAGSGLKLTTGGFLTFKSTATQTAWLGDMTGRTIVGDATVERYIPDHSKAWQFLSTPTTGQTVKQAWQENYAPGAFTPGFNYGTIITSPTGTGFDLAGITPSMKTYNTLTNDWTGIANTGIPIANSKGYMIFIRGDRSIQNSTGHSATTLRTKGTLYTPANVPSVVTVIAGKTESVGNPYASAIDLTKLNRTGGVADKYYVWDPKLGGAYGYGGYRTFTRSIEPGYTTYDVTPNGSGSYLLDTCRMIESGQAFFVQAGATGGTVTFTESAKAGSGSNLVTRGIFAPILSPEPEAVKVRQLRTNLRLITAGEAVLIDGNLIQYHPTWSNNIDVQDAVKLNNTGENLGVLSAGNLLAVERRATLQSTDTILFQLGQLRVQQYEFEFSPVNMSEPGLTAYLEDKYLNTYLPVSLDAKTMIRFNIINVPGSYAPGRFQIVFRKKTKSVPVILTINETAKGGGTGKTEVLTTDKTAGITVYPNPVTNKTMQLQFNKQAIGSYNIQLINQLGQPVYNNNLQLKSSDMVLPVKLGSNIPAGTYQLSVEASNGVKTTQQLIIE